jgi:ABC-type uncharacterized transport system fused permease/ATPase subunit
VIETYRSLLAGRKGLALKVYPAVYPDPPWVLMADTASLVLALVSVWGRMTAQRRWRAWLTKHLINYWLGNERYRRLRLIPGEPRYPEYRIADDARSDRCTH